MPDLTQIHTLIKQYKANGGDMAALDTTYHTLPATGKTHLGLNQWQRSDKPMMEDFNEDNRIVDEKLRALSEEKADSTIFTLTSTASWFVASSENNVICRTGIIVTGNLYMKALSDYNAGSGIFSLPKPFWPQKPCRAWVVNGQTTGALVRLNISTVGPCPFNRILASIV